MQPMKTIDAPIITGLPDICSDFLSYSVELRRAGDPGSSEMLRSQANDLLAALEQRGQHLSQSPDTIREARFALVAFLDEVILNSTWPVRNSWRAQPLQLEHFNMFDAGNVVYEKIETLKGNPKDNRGLLEVYYFVLCLGFRGRYNDYQGMEVRRQVITDLHRILSEGDTDLSPNWRTPDSLPRVISQFPVWVVVAICAAIVVSLFIGFLLDVQSDTTHLVDSIQHHFAQKGD